MRRYGLSAIVLVMAFFLYSCTQELEQLVPVSGENMQEITITASLADGVPFTKTVVHYENDQYNLLWEPGDKISLFYGSGTNGGQVFTSLNTEEAYVASFSGSITAITLGGEGTTLDDINFWGIYPYREDNACDGNTITTTLPDVQTARAGSFDRDLYISMGKSFGLNIGFLCACSGIRFRVTHPGISQIVYSGNNGEILAGRVKLGFGSDGKPKVMEVLDGKTSITLNAPNGGTFEPGTDYYIVTFPVQFSASMKMNFIKRDGNSAIRRWKTSSIELKRNIIKEYVNTPIDDDQYATFMETVDLGLTSGTLWATCNLGAASPEAAGNYYAWGELTPRTGNYGTANATISAKYQNSALTQLEPEDDAAYSLMGGDWRLPTQAQLQELKTECTWSLVTLNDKDVYHVVGPNGNSIYIPVAGSIRSGTTPILVGESPAALWSSTKSTDDPKAIIMTLSYYTSTSVVYCDLFGVGTIGQGMSIRPVRPKTHITNHEFVEMGDGLKWATCNVGADNPWDYGNYYAWGDITPKSSYTLDNYFDKIYLLYAPDKTTRLMVTHDAARCNWGGDWRMPTASEWYELNNMNHFTWTWTNDYNGTGVKGMIVTSKVEGYVGNRIFLPAAGYKYGEEGSVGYGGIRGYYWSSDLWSTSESAQDLYFYYVSSPSIYTGSDDRYKGFSVRPVCE